MKKFLKIAFIVALCLSMITATTAFAVTPSYAPYLGYEYNSFDESVAAPIGYTPEGTISGGDFEFSVNYEGFTDISVDTHDADYPSLYVLDGVAGVVYKTDTSLNVRSIYNNFTNSNGAIVNLKGSSKIANDYNNSYFYVNKGNNVYIVSAMSKVVNTIKTNGVVAMTTYAAAKEDGYNTYLLLVTADKQSGVSIYDATGKYIGFSKIGKKINDISFNIDMCNFVAIDGGANRVLRFNPVTDYDEDGNEILTGVEEPSESFNPKTNISGATSVSSDSMDEFIYVNLGNRILKIDTFMEENSYITSTAIPRNSDAKFNYSSVVVATDTDTIIALNTANKRFDKYNSLGGYISTTDKLGLTLSTPSDMVYKNNKYVYILDSGNSRILKLNKNLTKVISIFSSFHHKKLGYLSFYGAQGLTIDEDENFYIADTENYRVILANNKGIVNTVITRPDQQLQDTESPFRATKVLLDRKDQLYIICDSINLGAFVYDLKGNFKSFFGSNNVQATAEVILNYVKRQFMTRDQLKTLKKVTPIALTNFDIDSEGFIYTVTLTEQNRRNSEFANMIRKLNFKGNDIFALSGNSKGFGDFEWDRQSKHTNTSFVDVDVDSSNYINLIDSGRGKVFQYSEDGDLITVFGGYSNQTGSFAEPVAIESIEDKIFVLDKLNNNISVFKPTAYTVALRKAYNLLDSSDSDAALAAWEDVLRYNTNSQYPYYGMGRAYEMKSDYENAMKYFKLANAKPEYSKSFQEYRKDYVSENIGWMAIVAIVAIAIIVIFVKIMKKKMVAKHGSAYSPLETKWGMPIYVLMHPVDGFEQFRNRNIQSVPIAIGLVIAWFLVKVVQFFATGFAFNNNRAIDYDFFANVISTIGLYVLFVIANWAVCTLLNGKGRMKEILCVVAYALTPILITTLINVILSNTLTLDEQSFISIVNVIGLLWAGIVLLLGLYTIHQYSFGGTLGSTLLTILGMAIIALLVILFFTLLQQCYAFVLSIISELKLR